MRQSYKITNLAIQHQNTHTASWKAFGRRAIKGTEHIYGVKDANYLAVVFPARGDFIRKNTDFNPLPIGQQAGLTVFPALNRG